MLRATPRAIGKRLRRQSARHQAPGIGARCLKDIEVWGDRKADARERRDRLVEENPTGRERDAEPMDRLEDLAQKVSRVQLAERHPVVAADDRAQRLAKLGFEFLGVANPYVAQPPRKLRRVLIDHIDKESDRRLTVTGHQLTDHPKVNERKMVRRLNQDVCRMRICVEEAVIKDHGHPGLGHAVREALAILAGHRVEIEVRERRARHRLHGEHSRGRVLPEHRRDVDGAVTREVPLHDLGVSALDAVVEFVTRGAREFVDDGDHIDEADPGHTLADDSRELVHQRDVGVEGRLGVRALNFHHHLTTICHTGDVDLADRRRRQRRLVKLREDLADGSTELALDCVPDFQEGHGADVILKQAKLLEDVLGDEIRPCRQELPELHKRRTELFEHIAQATTSRPRRPTVASSRHSSPGSSDEVAEPVACGDLSDLPHPPQVPAPRSDQHVTGR